MIDSGCHLKVVSVFLGVCSVDEFAPCVCSVTSFAAATRLDFVPTLLVTFRSLTGVIALLLMHLHLYHLCTSGCPGIECSFKLPNARLAVLNVAVYVTGVPRHIDRVPSVGMQHPAVLSEQTSACDINSVSIHTMVCAVRWLLASSGLCLFLSDSVSGFLIQLTSVADPQA